ncbi:MAG: glycosyltransferase [Spirochaetaceae bacterium]|nr:MAG: glycosyltransferase [Spirochaetaceae bacterium]
MKQPGVSVIIPVYNRYSLLCEAVQSVLAQSRPALEVIVVDDGSTDIGPAEVAALTAMTPSPPVRYHRIDHCGMPGAVRNAGVARAAGEWIAFLDSDDLWYPHKLARQLECARRFPDRPLVHTRERWLRNGREVSQAGQRHAREGWVFADALHKCTIGPSTVLMRRELFEELGGFRPDLEVAEDYEFWLRLTARHQVAYVDEPLIDKRAGHGDQLSEKYGQIERFRIDALQRLVDEGYFALVDAEPGRDGQSNNEMARAELARAELARKCSIYARGAAKRGRAEEARRYEELAVRYGTD